VLEKLHCSDMLSEKAETIKSLTLYLCVLMIDKKFESFPAPDIDHSVHFRAVN
jgi:hypothetical protein